MAVTFRNAITGDRRDVDVRTGQTVHQAVEDAGIVAPGNAFSVRDKDGELVDNEQATSHEGKVLSVGLAGGNVRGGTAG
jgi:uncharacterized surface anchored protein